jgi:hypothetical protein
MRQLISATLSQISCLQPSLRPKTTRARAWWRALEGAAGHAKARATEHHPLEVEHREHDGEPFPRLAGQVAGRHPAVPEGHLSHHGALWPMKW